MSVKPMQPLVIMGNGHAIQKHCPHTSSLHIPVPVSQGDDFGGVGAHSPGELWKSNRSGGRGNGGGGGRGYWVGDSDGYGGGAAEYMQQDPQGCFGRSQSKSIPSAANALNTKRTP